MMPERYDERTTPGAELATEYTLFLLAPPGTMMTRGSCYRANLPDQPVPAGQTLIEGRFPDHSVYLGGVVIDALPPVQFATVANVKGIARRLLQRTDWYVSRALEDPDQPIPAEVLAERRRIRARSNEIEARLTTEPMTYEDLTKDETWA